MRLDRQHVGDAGDVGLRGVRVLHQAGRHRIGDRGEDDGDGRGGLDSGLAGGRGHREDQVDFVAHELLGDGGGVGHVALSVLLVVGDVLALDEARCGEGVDEALDGRVERRVADDLGDADLVGLAGGGLRRGSGGLR